MPVRVVESTRSTKRKRVIRAISAATCSRERWTDPALSAAASSVSRRVALATSPASARSCAARSAREWKTSTRRSVPATFARVSRTLTPALCAAAAPIFVAACNLGFRHAIIPVVPVRDPTISSAVEDYAKAIYALEAAGAETVTTTAIAERLGVTPGSASAMVRKLRELELVSHKPYKGVRLTSAGRTSPSRSSATTGCWSSTWPRASGCRGTACTRRPRCSSTSSPRSSRT